MNNKLNILIIIGVFLIFSSFNLILAEEIIFKVHADNAVTIYASDSSGNKGSTLMSYTVGNGNNGFDAGSFTWNIDRSNTNYLIAEVKQFGPVGVDTGFISIEDTTNNACFESVSGYGPSVPGYGVWGGNCVIGFIGDSGGLNTLHMILPSIVPPCSPSWSSWSSWSSCSTSCGGGTQTRTGTDGCGGSQTQSQSCNTQACNIAPVAIDLTYITNDNTAVSTTLSATDSDGNSLTYLIVTNPSNGVLSGTGVTRTYTPNSGFSGIDSYTYLASDGSSNSNIATITIIVNDISAPVITIVSPLVNQEYGFSDILFEITTDEQATVWFSVDGENNVTMSTTDSLTFSNTITLSHGKHNVIFYAIDSEGNEGANSVSFSVDTRKDPSGDKDSWRDNYLFETLSATDDFLFSGLVISEDVKEDVKKSSQALDWIFSLIAIFLVVVLIVLFMKSSKD